MTTNNCDTCGFKAHDNGDDFTPADSWCANRKRKNRNLPEKQKYCKYWTCRTMSPEQVSMALSYYRFNLSNAKRAKDPATVIARALVKNGWAEDMAQASAVRYIATCRSLKIWDERKMINPQYEALKALINMVTSQ